MVALIVGAATVGDGPDGKMIEKLLFGNLAK
jgi:hypothetical protein